MNRPIQRLLALLTLSLLLTVGAWAATDTDYNRTPETVHVYDNGTDIKYEAILPRVQSYDGCFADVAPESWYYASAAAGYEYALFNGRSETQFAPDAEITVAELLTLSARVRAAYEGDAIADTAPWSPAPYADYLRQQGIYDEALTPLLSEKATRAQLAGIFAATLPEGCYDGRNATLITDACDSGAFITDVDELTPCREQILWMYRQGLLTGTDAQGSYHPAQTTTRAEVAAVLTRMVDPALRLTPDWVVLPRWSAVGMTLASLVKAPDAVPDTVGDCDDATVDALVREMLSSNKNTIRTRFGRAPEDSEFAEHLIERFLDEAKGYCEQMYNFLSCTMSSRGTLELTFSATACSGETLASRREETMARAIEVHDRLWESGQLNREMSQYEIAKVYFLWLCDNCEYDYENVDDDYAMNHLAYGALIDGKAVCDGYTGAYNLFLKMEGIECRGLCNEDHIWTVAVLDGETYHIDVTWGDQDSFTDMSFFAMTEEESLSVHA